MICSICKKPKPSDADCSAMMEHQSTCSEEGCNGPPELLHLCWPWTCSAVVSDFIDGLQFALATMAKEERN